MPKGPRRKEDSNGSEPNQQKSSIQASVSVQIQRGKLAVESCQREHALPPGKDHEKEVIEKFATSLLEIKDLARSCVETEQSRQQARHRGCEKCTPRNQEDLELAKLSYS